MSPALLELVDIRCEQDQRILFEPLSLRCEAGDCIQVLGPNGSGKTTLLRCLAGINHNFVGELFYQGRPVTKQRWGLQRDMLYLGHLSGIKPTLTPLENLAFYAAIHDGASSNDLINALYQTGLGGYEETPCHQLSAGQLRRVALARLMLSSARVWILDEPFTAIDKAGVASLESLLKGHSEKGGVTLITSHQDLTLTNLQSINLIPFIAAQNEYGYDD